jgi:hypothetical protein
MGGVRTSKNQWYVKKKTNALLVSLAKKPDGKQARLPPWGKNRRRNRLQINPATNAVQDGVSRGGAGRRDAGGETSVAWIWRPGAGVVVAGRPSGLVGMEVAGRLTMRHGRRQELVGLRWGR